MSDTYTITSQLTQAAAALRALHVRGPISVLHADIITVDQFATLV